MDDLSKPLLNDISNSLDLDLQGDQGVMMTDIVVQCFNPPDENANPNLLDLIFTVNATGHKETMREQLISQVVDPIQAQFNDLTSKMGGNADLAGNAGIVSLRDMLSNNRMDTMIVTDIETAGTGFRVSPYEQSALMQAQDAAGISKFFSSVECDTSTLTFGAGTTIQGINDLLNEMNNTGGFSTTPVLPGCTIPAAPGCTVAGSSDCTSNNALLGYKSRLLTEQIFRCDLWVHADGSTCDIKDNDPSDNSEDWCLQLDGTPLPHTPIPCNLSEFVTYVQDFDLRINKSIKRVDIVSSMVMTDIGTNMKGLVDDSLINPLIAVTL
jgi:hypothetical protein